MANPINADTFYQNPTNEQWVTRDGETRSASDILLSAVRSGSATATLTVLTTATAVRTNPSEDLGKRHTVMIINDSAEDVFFGFDSGVTTSDGIPIVAGDERSIFVDPNDGITIFAIAASSAVVRVVELK